MIDNGLSTGLNVLGPESGVAMANLLEIPVLMIVNTDNGLGERYSESFKLYLKKEL